jgi:acetyl esterase/lipase
VTPRAPRSLLLAAAKDDLVDPQRNTAGLALRLRAAGVPVTTKLFGRVNHVTLLGAVAGPLALLAPVRAEILAFLGLPPSA